MKCNLFTQINASAAHLLHNLVLGTLNLQTQDRVWDWCTFSTGEKFTGSGDAVAAAAAAAIRGAAKEEAEDARSSQKAAKKAAFDSEYDVGAWSHREDCS